MKPTNKSPYEIRLDLLQLAFNILKEKQVVSTGNTGGDIAAAPTSEEVIIEATKLNEFVSVSKHNF
jgi:hypothetical protein